MRGSSRAGALCLLVGGGALSLLFAACTGDDPNLTSTKDAGQPESGGDASQTDAGGVDAPADAPGVETSVTRPECVRATTVACAPTVLPAGGPAPKLHLDACALPDLAVERELSPWAPVVGPSLANAPGGGGIYCAAGLNQRPAVRFEESRGYQLASASALDYTDSLVLVAALSYEAKPGVPGSIIFSRSNGTASTGFPGPTLAGNMTYVAPFGSTNIDAAPGIGMQFRLGERPANPSTPTATDSIAVVTTDYRSGPLIVVVRVVPSPPSQTYELRINGKFEKQVVLDSVFTSTGAGEMLRIGHTSQAENAFFGYLGELMFFTSDRTDYLDIETAMLAKWGVPRAN